MGFYKVLGRGLLCSGMILLVAVVWLSVAYSYNVIQPRGGPIYVVEVALRDKAELNQLAILGFDIARFVAGTAEIYATDAELRLLQERGYVPKLVEVQGGINSQATTGFPGYYTYEELTIKLQQLALSNPAISKLHSIGKSVDGRELWAVKISDNPELEEMEPAFKYVSTMHGDEPVGMQLCVRFIELLLAEYGRDERVTNLINQNEIWIMPLMNPDGLMRRTRYNASGYDLNRSFPVLTPLNLADSSSLMKANVPENLAVITWSTEQRFVLSANMHGGAVVANYPYDDDNLGSNMSPTPDHELFITLAKLYSFHNKSMWNSSAFPQGITNGADWYVVRGGMQDWNYRALSINEITLEVSQAKVPSASYLNGYWDENRESMLQYLAAISWGVRGTVFDRVTHRPVSATIAVQGNNQPVNNQNIYGDFYRMLLPGRYNLIIKASGYETMIFNEVTIDGNLPTYLEVGLEPIPPLGHGVPFVF